MSPDEEIIEPPASKDCKGHSDRTGEPLHFGLRQDPATGLLICPVCHGRA